ncbi:hypothetical protein STVA_06610 [Allostella vacuolata]|nr:hypothetical protein STVA_06610 [Stella vacuolata]
MVFDDIRYLKTLAHLGHARRLESLPHGIFVRPIPGTQHHDALGPWPYASAPDPRRLPNAMAELLALGAVSFTGVIRPDADVAPLAAAAGDFLVVPLKPHFVIAPGHVPGLGARSRRNLSVATRHWDIDTAPDPTEAAAVATRLHQRLQARRRMSPMTRMAPGHFPAVLALPGMRALAARAQGTIGALIVAARDAGETHLLHLLVDEDTIATGPAYLLMDHVARHWAADGPVYMGGAPDGPDGPGIGHFKARWASHTRPTFLLTAIVRPDLYAGLASEQGAAGSYFPAYRAAMPATQEVSKA